MNLILLDLDGTLVDSMPLENELYPRAVKEGLGISSITTDWSSFPNPTDSGIIREVMREELGKLCHPDDIERCRSLYIALLSNHLEKFPDSLKPVSGALEFIRYLENSPKYGFAVATAGWRISSQIKLAAAGFEFDDWIMYSCCDYEYKKEAMKAAHSSASKKYQEDFEAVLYIGDSRSDLKFANELGYEFLGRGEDYAGTNIWGVEGIRDFSDLRIVEGKIHRSLQIG
ncbi:MAG: HAD hydrolase-like protein [Verrucomicrobiae bacterium]|nr:HAD hydrolase-like protein [Verrucomicrobiae bacterium]